MFKPVIESVVFSNCITDSDYSPAYLDRKSDGTFDKEGATPDETYFIVLSPGARDKDVINATPVLQSPFDSMVIEFFWQAT